MIKVLVDTNVLISFYQKEKNRTTLEKLCYSVLLQYGEMMTIPSVILEFLPSIRDLDKNGKSLSFKSRKRFDKFLLELKNDLSFADITEADAWKAVEIARKCKAEGNEIPTQKQADLFLVAIATNRGWRILTEEQDDFEKMKKSGIDVPLFNTYGYLKMLDLMK